MELKALAVGVGLGAWLGLLGSSPVAAGGEWPQFRGSNGQGIAAGGTFPIHFGPGTNLLWKTPTPLGHSSPVVFGDRLFLTATAGDGGRELQTVAIDLAGGGVLWTRGVQAPGAGSFHAMNNAASTTPVVDAERVYSYFGTYGVVCHDHEGKPLWERRLPSHRSRYGMATSPIAHAELLILVLDVDDGQSRILAMSRRTGETVWEQPRPLFRGGWSTPSVFTHGGVDELVVLGGRRLTAYNVADGTERWWLGGFPDETVGVPIVGETMIFAGSAALGGRGDDTMDAAATWKMTVAEFDLNKDNQIQREEMTKGFGFIQRPELPRDNPGYALPIRDMETLLRMFDQNRDRVVSEGEWMQTMAGFAARSRPYLAAIRPGASGDAGPTHLAWEFRRGIPETSSLLHHEGRLHLMRDGGVLTCLRAETGEELFRERLGAPGQYVASPVASGRMVLFASVPGVLTVVEGADELRILGRNEINEEIYATPAIVDGRVYVRTVAHLYAFGQSPTQTTPPSPK